MVMCLVVAMEKRMVNGYSDFSNGDARGRVRDERSVLTGNDVLMDVDNTEGMSLVMQKVKGGTQLTEIKFKKSVDHHCIFLFSCQPAYFE